MSRPEKILEDEDFENSNDLKKMIDKGFFDVEHIDVNQIKTNVKINKVFKQDVDNAPKTSQKIIDEKPVITIENKEHSIDHDIVKAEEVLNKPELPKEDIVKVEEILNPQEEAEVKEELNSVEVNKVEEINEAEVKETETIKNEQAENKPEKKRTLNRKKNKK
jgi:propanediol dehydratase large subunit